MYCIPATGRIPSIVTKIKENLDDEQKNSQEEKQKKKPKKKSKKYLQKMVKHCFFPNCNPNYVSRDGSRIGKKVPIFRLPKNEEECAWWIKAIPLKKTINSKTSFICERHWPTGYAKISKKGKERLRDPPLFGQITPTLCLLVSALHFLPSLARPREPLWYFEVRNHVRWRHSGREMSSNSKIFRPACLQKPTNFAVN